MLVGSLPPSLCCPLPAAPQCLALRRSCNLPCPLSPAACRHAPGHLAPAGWPDCRGRDGPPDQSHLARWQLRAGRDAGTGPRRRRRRRQGAPGDTATGQAVAVTSQPPNTHIQAPCTAHCCCGSKGHPTAPPPMGRPHWPPRLGGTGHACTPSTPIATHSCLSLAHSCNPMQFRAGTPGTAACDATTFEQSGRSGGSGQQAWVHHGPPSSRSPPISISPAAPTPLLGIGSALAAPADPIPSRRPPWPFGLIAAQGAPWGEQGRSKGLGSGRVGSPALRNQIGLQPALQRLAHGKGTLVAHRRQGLRSAGRWSSPWPGWEAAAPLARPPLARPCCPPRLVCLRSGASRRLVPPAGCSWARPGASGASRGGAGGGHAWRCAIRMHTAGVGMGGPIGGEGSRQGGWGGWGGRDLQHSP